MDTSEVPLCAELTSIRTKELTYNYVDRVRLADHSLQQDYKCPTRGSGWRHNNKSISHLDLATSCHSTAFGPSHWPHNRQLRHSRSLDYAHISDRCKDPLDIAEFYWRLDPEGDALYEDEYEDELPDDEETLITRYNGEQRQVPPYRDYNYAEGNYHSTNANNNSQLLHPPHLHHNSSGGGDVGSGAATSAATAAATLQAFDFGSESCSLRRSRSLAVIREETFSDLQITTANNSRRSQLIPRARIVNRGLIREHERLICGGGSSIGIGANKHHHHHHHASGVGSSNSNANTLDELGPSLVEQKVQHNNSINVASSDLGELHQQSQHIHAHSHPNSHQHRHHHHHHTSGNASENLQTHHTHSHPHPQSPTVGHQPHQHSIQQHNQPHQSREADDYYDNLKRLDALTLGLVEQLHPWHNEKSDLESLNSDYFKNSLHQSHELQQQLDFEALEEAVSFLTNEKPRIYQSHRQQRALSCSQQKLHNATDSYQENSQSSVFPETTTSNSDDQTDSQSLSEQEYDLKKIEKIYKKTTELDGDEEGYELISLTTTTRTCIETTEDEEQEQINRINCTEKDADDFGCSATAEDFNEACEYGNGVLKRSHALGENLEKLIVYDSVYLSSEESSESTLIEDNHCEAYEHTTHVTTKVAEDSGETSTLPHFSLEDIICEPHPQEQCGGDYRQPGKRADTEIANATVLVETEAAEIAKQTTKENQLVSVVETVNTKIEKIPLTVTALLDAEKLSRTLESTTLYTQILKVGHNVAVTCTTPKTSTTTSTTTTKTTTAAQTSVRALVTAPTARATATSAPGVVKPAAHSTCLATQPTVGITSSVASKPKILSVVEKRKWKRHNDSITANTTIPSAGNEVPSIQPRSCGLEQIASSGSPPIDYPQPPLKRQLTADSLTYLPFQKNLSDNQYHSLPDVNIGQSLKVSECIDAKLRSSYNVHNTELDDCYLREATTTSTTTKTTLVLENSKKCKLKQQREEIVTSEEIYDSIKKFGRAHQKARKKEYQELHEVHVEKEKKREVEEKRVKTHETVEEAVKVNEQTTTSTTTTTAYPDSLGEEIVEQPAEVEREAAEAEVEEQKSSLAEENCYIEANAADDTESNVTASSSLDNSTSEYQEQPKDAPEVEVENFSKLIERRAKEIKAQADKRTLVTGEGNNLKNFTKIQRSDAISKESLRQPTNDYRACTNANQFRIVVTDAHNNIIEEDAIEKDVNLNHIDKDEATKKYQQLNLADVTIRRQEKREKSTKDKSTIVSTHTRVASLKRVPSKPKRQHQSGHYHHCCQQQHKDNSNKGKNNSNSSNNNNNNNNKNGVQIPCNTSKVSEHVKGAGSGNGKDRSDSNNYCELSIKSKERRVLSTQIYKARPIKVLTANDSFRRRSTEGAVTAAGSKMSRPQILHVVDNKRRTDILGNGKSVNSSSTRGGGINYNNKANRIEGSQIESEYLKKVDAVRNYWSKLAKDEDGQQQECAVDVEVEQVQKASLDLQTLRENVNELTKVGRVEDVQAKQAHQPQPEPRHFILGVQPEQTQLQAQSIFSNQASKPIKSCASANQDDYCSFMPSIEIVELAGDKKATIVSAVPPDSTDATVLANDANGEPQFDHIRYKVLKSQQLLRSNMVPRSKKEAQFDGLIQYLQEYSFQELLANNNVVIVEPVRTKIERPLTTIANAAATAAAMPKLGQSKIESNGNAKATNQSADNCGSASSSKMEQQAKLDMSASAQSSAEVAKMQPKTGTASCSAEKGGAAGGRCGGNAFAGGGGGGGIKRHFFYQPVRVNRELYEEELPNPDIVRNVRKFFEENVLPTPRGGMQLRHTPPDEETFVERSAATQLPSPRARRARKYRYLTIDTSYGHMPHQNQHQLPQKQSTEQQAAKGCSPTARKWDTASLSSGISSGDLSSACECNETETLASSAEKQETVNEEVLKGVHVQAVVQKHNNRNMRSATSALIENTVSGGENECNGHLPRPRPRPRSVIRGGEDSTHRVTDIYEQHASQQQSRNFAREDENRRTGDAEASDDEDADDEDLDDDAYESHYVSKDVLEKIRECGSTVTYYGGRVLQSTSPDPQHYGNGYNGAVSSNSHLNQTYSNTTNTNTMTLTRRRVRQIESCNACEPPKDCTPQQSTRIKFPQQHEEYNDKNMGNSAAGADDNRESSLTHIGIKFKLVKSNSCSSRLELAGTGVEIVETGADDAEVVKRMVHHFERTKLRQVEGNEESLTINNQTSASRALCGAHQVASGAVGEVKQVTVNNHINVPMTTYVLDDVKPANVISNIFDRTNHTNNKAELVGEKTYESSAMDIRLSNAEQRKPQECAGDSAGGDGNGTLKVWRNKNVDLAFTMAKQQTDGKATNIPKPNQCIQSETLQPSTPTSSNTVASLKRILSSNMPLKSRIDDNVGSDSKEGNDVPEKINLKNDGAKPQQQSVENRQMPNEAQRPTATPIKTQAAATTTPILAPRSTRLPAQIVVPVEIHRTDQQTPEPHGRTSVASSRGSSVMTVITTSSTALLDKSVVRHYVANDKSLFEKRKYDDIEFEEFEIYDPTKDFEKLVENEKRREEAKREGLQQQQQQQQQAQQQPGSGQLAVPALHNADTRHADEDDEEEDGRKSKLGSDCYDYDSLEDKL